MFRRTFTCYKQVLNIHTRRTQNDLIHIKFVTSPFNRGLVLIKLDWVELWRRESIKGER